MSEHRRCLYCAVVLDVLPPGGGPVHRRSPAHVQHLASKTAARAKVAAWIETTTTTAGTPPAR
jgi:hypothetical protein